MALERLALTGRRIGAILFYAYNVRRFLLATCLGGPLARVKLSHLSISTDFEFRSLGVLPWPI
jgi:hypothetical protein